MPRDYIAPIGRDGRENNPLCVWEAAQVVRMRDPRVDDWCNEPHPSFGTANFRRCSCAPGHAGPHISTGSQGRRVYAKWYDPNHGE